MFPVCPSVPQQFPVMVLEDSSTSQHALVHHSSFHQVTACPRIVAICWKNT
jgi:hypothetical protein